MDPLIIYILLVAAGIGICISARASAGGPTRACPQCGDEVSTDARACRACRYRFS